MKEQENLNNQYLSQEADMPEIDIKELIYFFISKWYLFTISVVILVAAGCFYLKTQPPIYNNSARVLIKVEQSAPEEMFLLQDLGLNMSGTNNIDNEIGIFKSPDLIARVITALELHTTYRREKKFGFYSPELYKESPLYVRMEDIQPENIPCTTKLIFHKTTTGFKVYATYSIEGQEKLKQLTIDTLPGYLELEIGKFYVDRQKEEFGNSPLVVTISNAMNVARNYIRNLEINTTSKNSSLLDITLKAENKKKSREFISALISEYNRDAVKDKNTVAYNTSVFIDERIKEISRELGEVEGQVESFRREYNVADIETQVGSYIRQGESYESRRVEIETQLNLVRFIESYIKKPENITKLVPNLGIKDPSLVGLINEYNTLLINRERIETSTSADNPSLKQINQQVRNMNQNIITSLSNEIRASEIALADLERENTITSAKIGNVPTLERQFTDIIRQQEVKSNLFVYLLQKREETNLTQAAVAPKAKIIAKPNSGIAPVSPRKAIILLLFFIIGFAIPAIVLFIIDFFQTKITGMKELEKLVSTSLVGDIAKAQEVNGRQSLIVKPNDTSIIAEMFRTMRNNILFMTSERDLNVILVTSTIPKEGKTFISSNLAQSISLMDKKVLLIGGDLRHPQVGTSLGIPQRPIGFSSYLAGHIQDYNEIIEKVEGNLYAMQSGPIPPNPNELLSKSILDIFFKQIKQEFDYIVIDSAPVGVVSDSFLLARHADATIYVVRENFSEKDTIQFINNITQDGRLKNVGIVLNDATNNAHGRYKYGYKYSYRYKYGYAQGYSHSENN